MAPRCSNYASSFLSSLNSPSLGVDYGVIKHCSDDEMGTLGVDYSKYEQLYDLLEEAEKLENNDMNVNKN